mmetsp:Transcript_7966/g.24607  ORF Transcript_7966/g.24607 Transcript_7966/m.24607 type:complete len:338 (-) Transcript_7966:176-1189(-)
MVTATGGSVMAKAALKDAELRTCSLEGFELASGVKLPKGAVVAYRVYGSGPKLAVAGTSYGVAHTALQWHVGRTIDDSFTFVVFNLLGNGVSYSPSTVLEEDVPYPAVVTVGDNVKAQKMALDADAQFGKDKKIDLVFGFSMGGMQAFEWARAYPEVVTAAVPICGSSGCEEYNVVFLEALIATLAAKSTTKDEKLRAFSSVYAGWYVGPDFYRKQVWKTKGFKDLDDWLENFAQQRWNTGDPEDLLAMVRTWRNTTPFEPEALAKITAPKVIIVPCDQDTYFRPEAIADRELKNIPNATMSVIQSTWGHLAGNPEKLPEEFAVIKAAIDAALAATA